MKKIEKMTKKNLKKIEEKLKKKYEKSDDALRVTRAVTRLTVYRPHQVCERYARIRSARGGLLTLFWGRRRGWQSVVWLGRNRRPLGVAQGEQNQPAT